MNQIPEPGKKIVSKGVYLKLRVKLFIMKEIYGFLLALALIMVCATVMWILIGLPCSLAYGLKEGTWIVPILALLLVPLLPGAAFLSFKRCEAIALKRRLMDNVVPLTRANIADLPAADSLVRASAEPAQEQQTILLRAAAKGQEGQETPPEQLVRAVGGPE